ncbi:MAG: hypothetical protein FWG31_06335 [Oscillospiraceae bacterium]|nr:hypothetical protein [Oscillospiraceae bacterium]
MPKKDLAELRKKRKEEQRRADDRFTWRVLCVMLFLALWTFLFYRNEWHPIIFALPVGVAVLYLLAYIYPKDFIALTMLISGGAIGLWLLTLLYQRSGRWDTVAHILFAAAIILSVFLIWFLRKKGGVIAFGKQSFAVMPRKGQYLFLFIACGALTAALVCTVIWGRPAALVAIIALFCYLFIAAVFYTIKLI